MVVFTDSHDISWFQYLHGNSCVHNTPSNQLSHTGLLLRDIRILSRVLRSNLRELEQSQTTEHCINRMYMGIDSSLSSRNVSSSRYFV